MGDFSFVLLGLGLVFSASMRPWLTLCVLSQVAAHTAAEAPILADYFSWMGTEPFLAILVVMASLEVVMDLSYNTMSNCMYLLRPLVAVVAVFSVMRFSNVWYNICAAMAVCMLIGLPFTRFLNSIIIPRGVRQADKGRRIKDHSNQEKLATIAHTSNVSIIKDVVCAAVAYFSVVNYIIAVTLILAAIALLVYLRRRLYAKLVATPLLTPQPVQVSKDVKQRMSVLKDPSLHATSPRSSPIPSQASTQQSSAQDAKTWATQPAQETQPNAPTRATQPAQETQPNATTWATQPAQETQPNATTWATQPAQETQPSAKTWATQPAQEAQPSAKTWATQPAQEALPSALANLSAPRSIPMATPLATVAQQLERKKTLAQRVAERIANESDISPHDNPSATPQSVRANTALRFTPRSSQSSLRNETSPARKALRIASSSTNLSSQAEPCQTSPSITHQHKRRLNIATEPQEEHKTQQVLELRPRGDSAPDEQA